MIARIGYAARTFHRLEKRGRGDGRASRIGEIFALVGGAAAAGAAVALVLALDLVLTSLAQPLAAQGDPRELDWEELMPEDWDPLSELEALMGDDLENVEDGSAQAVRLMNAYEDAVSSAPVVGELDGENVRLPGFVVPLDFEGTEISEFLLVPYFGACIHVPPPPSNQIVYVKTVAAYPLQELFDPVWVTGVLSTKAHLNDVGDAGYTIQATIIEPY